MYTVANLKDGVSGLASGTNLDKVTNLYKAFERAARILVQKVDIPEANTKENITLYGGVYDYPIGSDIFGGAIVDLQKQGITRGYVDKVRKMPVEEWDRTKQYVLDGYTVSFDWNDGTPIIRVATTVALPSITIDRMNEDDWTVGGSLSALTVDGTVYYEYPQSLRFLLTGASTGTLTKTLTTPLDLSTYEDVGVVFLAVRIPDGASATDITSMSLRIGSSASAYDAVSVTEGFLGTFTVGEWLLVAFDMAASSSTGTPDWSAIDYVQVQIAHGATVTNMRVGGLFIALPSPHNLIYQTAAIFAHSGTRTKTIQSDDDTLVLNDAAYNLYEHESALAVLVQQKQFKQADQMRVLLYGPQGRDDMGLYAQYQSDNPSQELRTVGSYYEEY